MTTDDGWGGRAWLWFCAGLIALLLGFLVGPRVAAHDQRQNCLGNVDLAGPFGIGLNCDSPQYMWLAREPLRLLDHRSERQGRPGLIFAAALITRLLSLVVPPDGPPLAAGPRVLETERISAAFARDLPAYVAYTLINCGILLLCFHLLRKIVAPAGVQDRPQMIILVAVGLLLAGNDVTKAFFWSPQTQLWNILVPVLAVYATLRVLDGAAFDRAFALGMGLAVGLGVTAYEVFAVIPACLVLPFLWAIARDPARTRAALLNFALLVLLSGAPMALWYAYVVYQTGEFFHIQAEQLGFVVWVPEALRQGNLGSRFLITLRSLLGLAAPQAMAAALLAGLLGVVAVLDRAGAAALRASLPLVLIGLYVGAVMLGFYTSVGWVADRLAYPAIPSLLAAAGAAATAMARRMDGPGRRRLAIGCLGVALVNFVWVVLKDGPWL